MKESILFADAARWGRGMGVCSECLCVHVHVCLSFCLSLFVCLCVGMSLCACVFVCALVWVYVCVIVLVYTHRSRELTYWCTHAHTMDSYRYESRCTLAHRHIHTLTHTQTHTRNLSTEVVWKMFKNEFNSVFNTTCVYCISLFARNFLSLKDLFIYTMSFRASQLDHII